MDNLGNNTGDTQGLAALAAAAMSYQPTGWAAVAQAVRDFDEQQVQDCKEDIDTLLTFSGLFSAAITGLIALSYNLLQEDTAGETLIVLRQISQQTAAYVLHNGIALNTTAALPPPLAPFEPSTAAILVNALWFASLVFSLATASIGILVKQWLREYMACKLTTSAQGRLRLRHYRSPGLATWKVFEIAASLPLLIQIALALFFIGLCVFTADANPTVGRSTLPLVIAWALFFIIVMLCPIFSARCPYKTPLLVDPLAIARDHINLSVVNISRRLDYSARSQTVRAYWKAVYAWALQRSKYCDVQSRPYNESDAIKYDGRDLDILTDADTLQSNDELLAAAMREAVVQSQLSVEDAISFVFKALRNRLDLEYIDLAHYPRVLDFRPLSRSARTAVVDILSYACGGQLQELSALGQPIGVRNEWVLCMLISPAAHPLPSTGAELLGTCLLKSAVMRETAAKLCTRALETLRQDTLLIILRSLCKAGQETGWSAKDAVRCLSDVLEVCLPGTQLPRGTVDRNWFYYSHKSFLNAASLSGVTVLLAAILQQELKTLPQETLPGVAKMNGEPAWPSGQDTVYKGIQLVFHLCFMMANSEEIRPPVVAVVWQFAKDLFAMDCTTLKDKLLTYLLQGHPCVILSLVDRVLPPNVFSLSYFQANERMVVHTLCTLLRSISSEPALEVKARHATNLCYTAMLLFKQREDVMDCLPRRFFDCVALVLESTTMNELDWPEHQANLFAWTIAMVDKHDAPWHDAGGLGENEEAYTSWLDNWDPEKSFFSDYFVSMLMVLYFDDGWSGRIRRLREMPLAERKRLEEEGRQNARTWIDQITTPFAVEDKQSETELRSPTFSLYTHSFSDHKGDEDNREEGSWGSISYDEPCGADSGRFSPWHPSLSVARPELAEGSSRFSRAPLTREIEYAEVTGVEEHRMSADLPGILQEHLNDSSLADRMVLVEHELTGDDDMTKDGWAEAMEVLMTQGDRSQSGYADSGGTSSPSDPPAAIS